MERRAADRARARERDADPGQWGVSGEILKLPAHGQVEIGNDIGGRLVLARKSDPFDLLYAHKDAKGRRGLTDDQHRAARRLMRDWCIAAGVRDQEREELGKIDGGRADPQEVTQAMIDADARRTAALKAIGGVNAKLMGALIGRMVDELAMMAWRGLVERVTGESDRNAQGALVRQACEALRLHYDELDEARKRHQAEVIELRPFGQFGG